MIVLGNKKGFFAPRLALHTNDMLLPRNKGHCAFYDIHSIEDVNLYPIYS